MNHYTIISIAALAGLLGHVPAEGFWGYFRKAHTVQSFHERYQGDGISHRQRVAQLRREGSSVRQLIRGWASSERQKLLSEIAVHTYPEITDHIHTLTAHREGNCAPKIEPCQNTPAWVVHEVEKLLPIARIPAEKLIIQSNHTSTSAFRIDGTTYRLGIAPFTLRTTESKPNVFGAIALHELAHMSLQHGTVLALLRQSLINNTHVDTNSFIKRVRHLHEFEADTYLTTHVPSTITAMHAYLAVVGEHYGKASEDGERHPSINRRCQNLKTISELLATEADTLD